MIYVRPDAVPLFSDERSVADFVRIPCDVVRRVKNRSIGRFVRNGQAFYIKVHRPCGWWSVADELLHARKPQIGAQAEWRSLETLRRLGIRAPRVVAYGQEGSTPASQQSFLVTEEIAPAISLEKLCERPRPWPSAKDFKRRLIRALARIARDLHTNGINHRDFYICHFLLNATPGDASPEWSHPSPILIDLHRAQIRTRTPRRWIVKDLGGLYFSAMDVDLSPRDLALFARCYSGASVRAAIDRDRKFWESVQRRAERLYRKTHQRPPRIELTRLFGSTRLAH